jgi:hypothetical protein
MEPAGVVLGECALVEQAYGWHGVALQKRLFSVCLHPSRLTLCEAYVLVQLFRVQMGRNSRFGTRKSLSSHQV